MKRGNKIFVALLLCFCAFMMVGCGKEKEYFTITFYDEAGSLLEAKQVEEGVVPSMTYNKDDTQEWNYSFDGWSETIGGSVIQTLPAASVDKTYYAIVSQVKQQYTITFDSNDGTEITNITSDYNTSVECPENPTKEGYKFVCWCTDEALTTAVEWPLVLTKDTTLYASWNEQTQMLAYLQALLDGYELNPYSYIPESLRPGYSANLVNESSLTTSYSDFVQVSNIKANGFGEQWHMVLENIQQSNTFFNVLTAVEGLTTTSITAFNNYLDQNPADTANYNFASGIYSVTINFDGTIIYYVLDYTATLPALGEQSIQIALSMNIETQEKEVRVQIGDANALYYEISENSYTFAIKYLGVRKAYFSVERDEDGAVEGHINEFLSVSGKGISSAVDFYIDDEYLSVVGNKAGGMIGFTGYISELYSVESGELLSYEVRETLSSITYNTLWFDLSNVSGITSIKYVEATDSTDAAFYVNNQTSAWETKKVGGLGTKMLSRRFDIEFRTQYFYIYNETDKVYEEVAVEVPMLFVQEENYATLQNDVKSTNANVTLNVTLDAKALGKVQSDYDTLVDIFITNKDTMTEEKIIEFIGDKIAFK